MFALIDGGLVMIRFSHDESPMHDRKTVLAEDASTVKLVQRLVEVHVRLQVGCEQLYDCDERAMVARPL